MVKIGAHMSIAGGYFKAVESACEYGMDVVQLFTKNNNQWAAKPLTDQDVKLFDDSLKKTGVTRPLSHASYLINLASPKDDLYRKSIDGMVIEWQRAEQLHLDGVVMHPGALWIQAKNSDSSGSPRQSLRYTNESHRNDLGYF